MANVTTIKVFELSRTTREPREIRTFPADEEIMNSCSNFKRRLAISFEHPEECIKLFWKGR